MEASASSASADKSPGSKESLKALYRDADYGRQREIRDEAPEPWREAFRRDYARVIHSPAFRRLQGKTQLFPGRESDFFRNRLTHSLEVAQIAESIAHRFNKIEPYFKENPISPRLCATAALMHDLGHPPFGHNGEQALDDQMRPYGGFEGNAQTLRIIARLEKKETSGEQLGVPTVSGMDLRLGLNLTFRSMASVLKYDRQIPHMRAPDESFTKGYYADEASLVEKIKNAVCPNWEGRKAPFKTVECAIMDIADDIAYSTYDLEDSLKAGFLTPADILASGEDILERVARKVTDEIGEGKAVTSDQVIEVFTEIFSSIVPDDYEAEENRGSPKKALEFSQAFRASQKLAESGYLRTSLTSQLVGEFINAVRVAVDEDCPALSVVELAPAARKKVEVLKRYTFEATIASSRLKLVEFRGYEVVTRIFQALAGDKGQLLMPKDVRTLYEAFESNASARMRVICDFIAGMTDRYAVELIARLHSDGGESIFKPI